MSKKFNAESMLSTFPEALAQDKEQKAIASVSADEIEKLYVETDLASLYTRIDGLNEGLLDILARDFKIDWYGYNYPLETKRYLVKTGFAIHRKLGTRGSVFEALRGLYKNINLEEWFEYGGEPYHFRTVFDVTEDSPDIPHDEIVRSIKIYKPKRSVLEDDAIFYRTRSTIAIVTSFGVVCYNNRLCGTYPNRSTQGSINDFDFGVDSSSGFAEYSVKMCGTAQGGIL